MKGERRNGAGTTDFTGNGEIGRRPRRRCELEIERPGGGGEVRGGGDG